MALARVRAEAAVTRADLAARIAAEPRMPARASADAARPLPPARRSARRARPLHQAGRPHGTGLRRQQDAPPRIYLRRDPGIRCRHRGRGRLHPVQLVPADHGGGAEARPRRLAGPDPRRQGAGAPGQSAARPPDGRRRERGRYRFHGTDPAAARREGPRPGGGRPAALRDRTLRPRPAGARGARLRRHGAGARRPARRRRHRPRPGLHLRRQQHTGRPRHGPAGARPPGAGDGDQPDPLGGGAGAGNRAHRHRDGAGRST